MVILAVATYLVVVLLAAAAGEDLPWMVHENRRLGSLLRSAVPAAVLLGGGAAGAIGVLRQKNLDATHALEQERYDLEQKRYDLEQGRHHLERDRYDRDQERHDAEKVSRLRDRYAAAAEQLGHESAAVRLAGVYSLAALADDWLARSNRQDAQVCVELLCAYFRTPQLKSAEDTEKRSENEVRQTITRVIAAHLQDPDEASSWCGMDFDFTGATFAGDHSFADVQFTGGTVSFNSAQFTSGVVTFRDARFSGGDVGFQSARFTGGNLIFQGAQFTGANVNFEFATIAGGDISFGIAKFTDGEVSFHFAHITGGEVDFIAAKFTGGHVNFMAARIDGGTVTFHGAQFTGGEVDFQLAKVAGGAVNFNEARFTGGDVSFADARCTGSVAQFHSASYEIPLPGPWDGAHPPVLYPPTGPNNPEVVVP
nr:pentapeptide repeat-containing protein [Micrococcus sp. TA1]